MDYAYFAQIMSLKYHIHITVPHILIDLDPSLRLFLSRSQCSLVKFFNIEIYLLILYKLCEKLLF